MERTMEHEMETARYYRVMQGLCELQPKLLKGGSICICIYIYVSMYLGYMGIVV